MTADALFADVIAATCMRAFLGDDPLPRSERAFADQVNRARTRLPAVTEGALRLIGAIATDYHALSQKIAALPPARSRFGAELAAQRDALVYAGFLKATPWAQLNHLPRYLQALQRRLAKAPENPAQDAKHGQAVAVLWERYRSRADANRAERRHRAGAGSLQVAARRAESVAFCPGTPDRAAGFIQAPGKGLGGAFPGISGAYSRWQRETARDTVSYRISRVTDAESRVAFRRLYRMAGMGPTT